MARTRRHAVLRKVDHRILPLAFLLFVASFLDRINVSFAALEMNRALGFTATVYGLGAGIFFVGFLALQVPSNLALERVGARRWLGALAIAWGIVATAMAAVQGATSFYALRLALGAVEAGFFPGMVLYLSRWYPASARGRSMGAFLAASVVATVIAGPLCGALLTMSPTLGLASWRWLFVLEGVPSIVLGVAALRWLTERPADATWLAPDERAWLTAHALGNDARPGSTTTEASRAHTSAAAASTAGATGGGPTAAAARVPTFAWALGGLWFLLVVGNYGVAYFLPQIVRAFSGADDFAVGLLSALPGIAGGAALVIIGARSDRRGERYAYIAGPALVAAGGLATLAVLEPPALRLAALCIAAVGLTGVFGPFWGLATARLERHPAATPRATAVGVAVVNSVGTVGGFVGPFVLGWLRDATGSFDAGLLALAALALAAAAATMLMRRAELGPAYAPRRISRPGG